MTTVSVNMQFIGPSSGAGQQYQLYPRFSDMTTFLWSPCQPISTSIWSGRFGDPVKVLPQSYLNIVVMNNSNTSVWAWPSISGQTLNTFTMPVGNITLQTIMNNLYNASRTTVTSDQYEDITGQPTSNTTCTVATALTDNAAALQYSLQFSGIIQESSTVTRILC